MEKIREFYSYPIYDSLSSFILDEVIYYDFIYKFYHVFGEDPKIHFIVYSLNKKDSKKLRGIVPYADIIEGEKYIKDINALVREFLDKKRVEVFQINTYYCEKCDEYFKKSEIKVIKKVVKENIAKIRIAKKTYFLGNFYEGEEPAGIYIGRDDNFVIVKLHDETWIAPANLREFLIEEIEVPANKINGVEFNALKDFNFEPYVAIGDGISGIIKKGEPKVKLIKRRISSYTIIYSRNKEVSIKTCPICGNVLREQKNPVLAIRYGYKRIGISSPEGSYKLPVLYCPNCGHIEYGVRIKECPVCGNIMERKFALRPELSALGAYIHNFNAPSYLMFLHRKRSGLGSWLGGTLRIYGKNLFKNTKYLNHKIPDNIDELSRTALLTKGRGSVNASDIRRIKKLQNAVENIVRYAEIYGMTKEQSEEDEWLGWKSNELKRRVKKLVGDGKIVYAFNVIYDHIMEDISRFYIPLKRKKPLFYEPIKDAIILLYPYMPTFAMENLEKMGVKETSLKVQESSEIRSITILQEFLKTLRKYREKQGIPRREPLKKVVFVTQHADEINAVKSLISNVENILIFQVTDDWDEMEIEIEPNMEEISSSYRAWAPKIAFLLRRKNVREILDAMEKGGYTLGIEGFIIKITPQMINYLKKIPEGYDHIEFQYGDIYIQNERDSTTKRIRLVNEVIRRINAMRKDIEMDFDDLVDVSISGDSDAIKMIRGYDEEIREKCLARNVELTYSEYGYLVEWPIMGYRITIGINPLFKRWVIEAFKSIPGVDESLAELLFKLGYGSVYELMEAEPEQLAESTGMPLKLANDILEYLYSTAFKPKKENKKEYCPFCGAELGKEDDYCPRCGAPIRVKMEERRMKKGNVYMFFGELDEMLNRIPEELMKERKLLVTKDDPDEIKKMYNLKNVESVWISYVPFGNTIKPKDLEKLKEKIFDFIDEGGKLIIADCFDLLLAINGLDRLLEMIDGLKAKLKERDAYLFFTVEELEAFEMGEIMKYVDGEVR